MLALGHCRFIPRFGDDAAGQIVDQGGFAHVGNAGDQGCDAGGAIRAFAGHFQGGIHQLADLFRLFGGDGQGAYAWILFQMGEPLFGDGGVGQVAFAKQFETGLVGPELLDYRVGAAIGQAGVYHFDDQVHLGKNVADFADGLVHVAGEPVDAHGRRIVFIECGGSINQVGGRMLRVGWGHIGNRFPRF